MAATISLNNGAQRKKAPCFQKRTFTVNIIAIKGIIIILGSLFLLVFAYSCTITKRVHRPGVHFEWKGNYKKQKSANESVVVVPESVLPSSTLVRSKESELEYPTRSLSDLKKESIQTNKSFSLKVNSLQEIRSHEVVAKKRFFKMRNDHLNRRKTSSEQEPKKNQDEKNAVMGFVALVVFFALAVVLILAVSSWVPMITPFIKAVLIIGLILAIFSLLTVWISLLQIDTRKIRKSYLIMHKVTKWIFISLFVSVLAALVGAFIVAIIVAISNVTALIAAASIIWPYLLMTLIAVVIWAILFGLALLLEEYNAKENSGVLMTSLIVAVFSGALYISLLPELALLLLCVSLLLLLIYYALVIFR